MVKLITGAALAATLMVPAWAYAQQNGAPLTREQVRAEVVALKNVGYEGITANDLQYPDNLQAALARVAAAQPTPGAPGQTR